MTHTVITITITKITSQRQTTSYIRVGVVKISISTPMNLESLSLTINVPIKTPGNRSGGKLITPNGSTSVLHQLLQI